ncbi:choline ethanolamine [Cyclospora cayetanensis]|uniref:Choline ethanolamine n=1 Tax=Cyclospora cayetanensis TaxID=88456 RepID=A0A1D3D392_9EIME|nr:choline ethanolamine [Cyclospora cayetanensis]
MSSPEWPFYSVLPNQMPSSTLRRHLVEVYLKDTIERRGLNLPPERLATKETVDRFVNVVDYMMLASHLVWAFWSVVRTKIPEDPELFSYLHYAKTRLEQYSEKKREMQARGVL